MSSILTNNGAMTALRTLQTTNRSLSITQNRVSTGMKVADAGDNAARWSVAATMRSDASAYGVLSDMHGVALAAVNLGIKAVDKMVEIYGKIKEKGAEWEQANANSDTDSTTALESEIADLETAAADIASGAEFTGVNFLTGGTYSIVTDLAGGTMSVAGSDVSGLGATTTAAGADTHIDTLKTLGQTLGAAKQSLEARKAFMDAMNDALKTGTGALVDADMTEESARLSALQVQQQLGAQAMGIANQAPQVLLSLFR
ncbi:flagellin [Novispirillum sp. DQ9]|uniref:flagellin N-terminal helical domain-containing protein n=1 Tax=Novispirillum sp. DQ9 TaxID=3398612 RepID=UPI003C7CDFB3